MAVSRGTVTLVVQANRGTAHIEKMSLRPVMFAFASLLIMYKRKRDKTTGLPFFT